MSNQDCYYPSGDSALDSTPCFGGVTSFCCPAGYACLANKLCEAPASPGRNATLVEGTCTDLTFLAPECPSHCAADQNNYPGQIQIEQCGNDPAVYCCGSCQSCAGNGSFITILGVSTASTIGRVTRTEVLATVTILQSTLTTSIAAQATPSNSSQTRLSSSATNPVILTGSATPTPDPNSTAAATTSQSHTNTTAIAAGVTVPVVVIAMAGVLLWLFLRRRSRRASPIEVEHKIDRPASKNWSISPQELPGDTGALEIDQVPSPKSELATADTVNLSPTSAKSPATYGPSSPKTPDIISPLSVRGSSHRLTHELSA